MDALPREQPEQHDLREQQLSIYHDGELPAETVPAFESVLRATPTLQSAHGQMQRLSAVFASAARAELSPLQMARLRQRIAAAREWAIYRTARFAVGVAAAVLLMCGIAGVIELGRDAPVSIVEASRGTTYSTVMTLRDANGADDLDEARFARWVVAELESGGRP